MTTSISSFNPHIPHKKDELKSPVSEKVESVTSVFQTSKPSTPPQTRTGESFNQLITDVTHTIEETKVTPKTEESYLSSFYSTVVNTTGNVISYGKDIISNVVETGKGKLYSGLFTALSYGNPIPLEETKEKLKNTSGSDIPFSAVNALMTLSSIKKEEKITHSPLPKEALQHPYWQELLVNLAANMTNKLFEKMEAVEGKEMSKFLISTLHTINAEGSKDKNKPSSNPEEFRAQTIKSMTEYLLHLMLPEGRDSLPITGILKTVDSNTGSYIEERLYLAAERKIEAICTQIFDTLSDEVTQKELDYKILKAVHKAVGSASYHPSTEDISIRELITFKDSTYTPTEKEINQCSGEVQNVLHNTLKDVISPAAFSFLTIKHVGLLAKDNKIFSYISHEATKGILSVIGSIDLKETTIKLLEKATSKALPTGTWENGQFTFDKDIERERVKKVHEQTKKREERLSVLNQQIENLTSQEAVSNLLIGVSGKLEHKLSSKFETLLKKITFNTKVSMALSSGLNTIVSKFLSLVQYITAKIVPSIIKKLSSKEYYKKSLLKVKETIRAAPNIALQQVDVLKTDFKNLTKKK